MVGMDGQAPVPSCLALNIGVIVGILLLTILFGRLYCSVICPLGVVQDFIIWIRREIGKLKRKCFTKRAQKAKEAGKPAPVMKVDLIEHLQDNLKTFLHFKPLNEEEFKLLEESAG